VVEPPPEIVRESVAAVETWPKSFVARVRKVCVPAETAAGGVKV
jgi:hypothetical protein